jgi:hypothetical protein
MRAPWFVAALPVLALGACGSAGSTQLKRPAGSAVTMTTLEQLAKSSAAFDGDPNVTSAEAVLTTEDGASRVMDSLDDPSKPIYIVQTQGNFTAYGASVPPTATKLPTGTYEILEIDASNGQVIGVGLQSADADLASMGSVVTLQL